MIYPQYSEIEKLIKEYEDDFLNLRPNKVIITNYSKVLVLSAASLFEKRIKEKCQDFLNSPNLPISSNYPLINKLINNNNRKPTNDQMYGKFETYDSNGGLVLNATKFYDLFGSGFGNTATSHFNNELGYNISERRLTLNALNGLIGHDDTYDNDYVRIDDLIIQLSTSNFSDAENAFLNIKLRRNKTAHDFINGINDTFEEIVKFYNMAVIYVVSLEKAISDITI